jgi:CTP:phosphocholine cytidylyltransferase-like protein
MVKGHSDDWLFEQDENGRITRVGKGGDDLYNMVGIAYFTRDDARCLGRCIKDAWGKEGYEDLFWDDVVDRNLDKLDLTVHPVNEGQLVEIDTVEELALVDPSYSRRQ